MIFRDAVVTFAASSLLALPEEVSGTAKGFCDGFETILARAVDTDVGFFANVCSNFLTAASFSVADKGGRRTLSVEIFLVGVFMGWVDWRRAVFVGVFGSGVLLGVGDFGTGLILGWLDWRRTSFFGVFRPGVVFGCSEFAGAMLLAE